MDLHRKQDLSIYYWLESIKPSSIVNVEDGFPDKELNLPTVSITNLDLRGTPHELGGNDLNHDMWRIDVFTKTKSQRDELATLVFDQLECNIPVYDYDLGFTSPPRIGTLIISNRAVRPIHVFEELVEKLYWRSAITFNSYYEPL